MTFLLRGRADVRVVLGVTGGGAVERAAQVGVGGDDVTDARAYAPQPLGVAPQLIRALRELRVAYAQLCVYYLNLSTTKTLKTTGVNLTSRIIRQENRLHLTWSSISSISLCFFFILSREVTYMSFMNLNI